MPEKTSKKVICPACGNSDIIQIPDGWMECLKCGFKWNEKSLHEPYNQFEWSPEEEQDWSDEDIDEDIDEEGDECLLYDDPEFWG